VRCAGGADKSPSFRQRPPVFEEYAVQGGLSAHTAALAGLDLFAAGSPAVRAQIARERVVVLSRSRSPGREVHLQHCRDDGVSVVIRPSGGGAVVLGPGVVVATIIAPISATHLPEPHFRRFCSAAQRAFLTLGVRDPSIRGVSDICVGDRKIAGSSLRIWGGLVLYQIAILVDLDLALLERYLPHPSREPTYRAQRPHREFVCNLRTLGLPATPKEICAAIAEELAFEASFPAADKVG
jgi:lipoate-protein ligase A